MKNKTYPTNLGTVNIFENEMLIRKYLIKESARSEIEKCTVYKISNITGLWWIFTNSFPLSSWSFSCNSLNGCLEDERIFMIWTLAMEFIVIAMGWFRKCEHIFVVLRIHFRIGKTNYYFNSSLPYFVVNQLYDTVFGGWMLNTRQRIRTINGWSIVLYESVLRLRSK